MVGFGESAMVPQQVKPSHAVRASHEINWVVAFLMTTVLISGYLISTADGKGIAVLDLFTVPALISDLPEQASRAGVVHWYSALALIILSAGHALAAFKHHYLDRQDTLVRMVDPRLARRAKPDKTTGEQA